MMRLPIRNYGVLLISLFFIAFSNQLPAQNVMSSGSEKNVTALFRLYNENVNLSVVILEGKLISDTLTGNTSWLRSFGSDPFSLVTDAGFGLKFVWTDWQAPKKQANADNPVILDKNDFMLSGNTFKKPDNGGSELILTFKGIDLPIIVEMTYRLDPGTFYFKRKIAVKDTTQGVHFLDMIMARKGGISKGEILKKGDFGQPVAIKYSRTGAFFGLEYPASNNSAITGTNGEVTIECSQEFGTKVGKEPVESEWVVEALVPTVNVKDWFFRYVNDIRVAPAAPYTLYNSWYDLRSPEYPKVRPENVMNEENVLNIIRLFRKNMIEKHNIKLDAFVLDDGWDVYQSDWILRKETFPRGLKPIADTLNKTGTSLGIWFGPTGGYSFRMKRVNWMKEHGYEVVGTGRDYSMLCLGGKNYSQLFQKRVTDLVANEGVAYFKWDGIQFSCSEPDHGHPIGIYSRRAILESLINKCKAVRAINPKTYLNITSGTWLSPWWVKYANQVWMQGEDYGYADVPSISQRDAAITYKDFVLYDDFKNKDWWFPVSNLMTHGIIKGNLERLGGNDDPLDKFTNDVAFYLARGISMYEMYISPDLLDEDEWNAIGTAINWAKDRREILSNTYMTGGDPTHRECYGYVHFKGNHGVIAVRNPYITASKITIRLSAEFGLDPDASSLVFEKVYPYRWISQQLYGSGVSFEIPLEGYETAIFELYPLNEAKEPLICGARFDVTDMDDGKYNIKVYDAPLGIKLLNPGFVKDAISGGIKFNPDMASFNTVTKPVISSPGKTIINKEKTGIELTSTTVFDQSVNEVHYSILVKPDKESEKNEFPEFTFVVDGKENKALVEQQKGLWSWYSVVIPLPVKDIKVHIRNHDKVKEWKGNAAIYAICRQSQPGREVEFTTNGIMKERPMLPKPFKEGISEKTFLLDEFSLDVRLNK
jgi:hypothetical protein